jgi:uncharacterized protein DUF3788
MHEVVLNEKSNKPNDAVLEETLGNAKEYLDYFIELTNEYIQEWKFYNKKSGWTLKIATKKKALLWLIPYSGYFLAGMALREPEWQMLLDSDDTPELIKDLLNDSKKYPEGFALSVTIKTEEEFEAMKFVVESIMNYRTK